MTNIKPNKFKDWKQRLSYWQKILFPLNNYYKFTPIKPNLNLIDETKQLVWGNLYGDRSLSKRSNLSINEDNPLSLMANLIRQGNQPPTELLLVFLEIYDEYIDSKGKLDLEEAFHGSRLSGVGNYSARYKKELLKTDTEITMYLGKLHKKSQDEIASEYVKDKPGLDEQTFLRRARKRNKIKTKTDK